MLIIPPIYRIDYVNELQRIPMFDYDMTTKEWVPTDENNDRVVIEEEDGGYWLYIDEERCFYWDDDGNIALGLLTTNLAVNDFPRLEFMRDTGGPAQRFATLSQRGIFSVLDVKEEAPPTGEDRVFFTGNNITVGMDGLYLTGETEELQFLIDSLGQFITNGESLYITSNISGDPLNLQEDTFGSYADGYQVSDLNGGSGWIGPWNVSPNAFGVVGFDNFDSYDDDANLDELTDGSGWVGGWSVSTNYLGVQGHDSFDDYTVGSTVTGLNSGEGWSGAWSVSDNYARVLGSDSFDDYTVGQDLTTLNAGSGWDGNWKVSNNEV